MTGEEKRGMILCVLSMLLGGAAGFILGRAAERGIKRESSPHPHGFADPALARQYDNFLCYDGTGKGQKNLED